MKKLFLLTALLVFASGILFAQFRNGDTAWVSSRTADLRSSTWFFASSRGTLEMGAQVTVLRSSGTWVEVRSAANSALSGWTQQNNLSARRIVSAGTGATAAEIALAGKGFDRDVENAFRAQGNLNFDAVDKVEAIEVPLDVLLAFMIEGRLNTGE